MYSAKAVFMLCSRILVSKCCKVMLKGLSTLQSQIVFYKGSKCESWEDLDFMSKFYTPTFLVIQDA